MATHPDSDVYPTTTFQNPLLMPLYIKTNDHTSITVQARDDWLLSVFIEKLNVEIIDEIEEFKDYKTMLYDIFWDNRVNGWCIVQPYEEKYRVFSSLHWSDWIKETNEETGTIKRIGVRVTWSDELGNNFKEDLYYEDHKDEETKEVSPKCYEFKWQNGNGRMLPHQPSFTSYALPDLSFGILSENIQIRQITDTLTFGATNPFFYHLKYGDSITPKQRIDLINQMSYIGVSKALGAKKNSLEEIVAIENGAVDKALLALEKHIAFYASVTRLPLSYYLGEKQVGSGLDSGGAEDAEADKLILKKESILQHILPTLNELFTEQFGINLDHLYNYFSEKSEEEKAEKEALLMNQSENNEDNNEDNKGKKNEENITKEN